MIGVVNHILEPKLQKPVVKIPEWFNKVLIKINSTQVVLVLNLVYGSISPLYYAVFYNIFLMW